jgi:hypothetical protein
MPISFMFCSSSADKTHFGWAGGACYHQILRPRRYLPKFANVFATTPMASSLRSSVGETARPAALWRPLQRCRLQPKG